MVIYNGIVRKMALPPLHHTQVQELKIFLQPLCMVILQCHVTDYTLNFNELTMYNINT